jgi:hypothetical protein
MERTRQQYLAMFLRGCAQAADANELHVDMGQLLVNGDLMREAAEEFEKLSPEHFATFDDELRYNIGRAEWYARQAHDLCYKRGRDRPRGFWFRAALGRAQSILMSLYTKELRRK